MQKGDAKATLRFITRPKHALASDGRSPQWPERFRRNLFLTTAFPDECCPASSIHHTCRSTCIQRLSKSLPACRTQRHSRPSRRTSLPLTPRIGTLWRLCSVTPSWRSYKTDWLSPAPLLHPIHRQRLTEVCRRIPTSHSIIVLISSMLDLCPQVLTHQLRNPIHSTRLLRKQNVYPLYLPSSLGDLSLLSRG